MWPYLFSVSLQWCGSGEMLDPEKCWIRSKMFGSPTLPIYSKRKRTRNLANIYISFFKSQYKQLGIVVTY